MFADLVSRPLPELNLGIRAHGSILAKGDKIVAAVFKRDKERCHLCGFRIPGFMEIDHRRGHKQNTQAADLKTVCQFCHNLRHPLWSAARKRMVPIFAPDLSQSDLHRLAWTLLAWRDVEDGPIDAGAVTGLIVSRREAFHRYLGCSSAEVLFESAINMTDPKFLGPKKSAALFSKMEQNVRFWPTELLDSNDEADPGSRFSIWDVGGYRVVAEDAAESIRQDQKPDFDKIRAGTRIATRKAGKQ